MPAMPFPAPHPEKHRAHGALLQRHMHTDRVGAGHARDAVRAIPLAAAPHPPPYQVRGGLFAHLLPACGEKGQAHQAI